MIIIHTGKRRRFAVLTFFVAFTIIGSLVFLSKGALGEVFSARFRPQYTVIVDPGHGGFDGGAVSEDGVIEKGLTLEIGKKYALLLSLYGINTTMTREVDMALDFDPEAKTARNKTADLQARLAIVRETVNPIFVSIHMNKYPKPQYYGAQVFYSENHEGSETLARGMQEDLVSNLPYKNNRAEKPAPERVFLTKYIETPAVIVECGFLSNPGECRLLQNEDYQNWIAMSLLESTLEYINEH